MAVYTDVSADALAAFLAEYDLGPATAFEGILQGIENTNYRLETPAGRFVLTLFERRAAAHDLPYFVALMAHLAGAGFPAPKPIPRLDGATIGEIAGKPAAIVTFLDGDWPRDPSPAEAGAAGAALARLHLAAADFTGRRPEQSGRRQLARLFAPRGRPRRRGVRPDCGGRSRRRSTAWSAAGPAACPAARSMPTSSPTTSSCAQARSPA